ncbi:MAG TPA: FAD-dependent monooxygenase, partial [Propionibacteriaceae bacterium]|nr:FAD-dependent monooxygenase [Propionibacteriaceae bacterium]
MSTTDGPQVMIIGGGIGGLCLAQGLRRAGIDVTVYERSLTRTDWLQGYRIHINPHGSRALHDCLEPANWQAFLDTVSRNGGGFGFITEQLRDLLRFRGDEVAAPTTDPADRHYGVSRISLRQVLLSGMDRVIRLGKTFESYEMLPDGRVTAHFADGSSATADLLIGADGANSRVRQQLLPQAERIDTGIVAVAGKHQLSEDSMATLPTVLTSDANIVIPAGRGFLFTAVWRHDRSRVAADNDMPPGFLLDNTADYTFWAYADTAGQFPSDVREHSGARLTDLIMDKAADWAPGLRELIGKSDPSTVNVVRVRSATPVDPWQTGPVTLLGDAIHNMTPMGGIGANTALRDADLLRRQLIAVSHGQLQLIPAVHAY